MKILITGLSGSGKTTLALKLLERIPSAIYLNNDEIREVFNDKNFSTEARIRQAKRFRFLASLVERDRIIIADFICPTEETRRIFGADVTIYMDTIKASQYSDTDSLYKRPIFPDFIILLSSFIYSCSTKQTSS